MWLCISSCLRYLPTSQASRKKTNQQTEPLDLWELCTWSIIPGWTSPVSSLNVRATILLQPSAGIHTSHCTWDGTLPCRILFRCFAICVKTVTSKQSRWKVFSLISFWASPSPGLRGSPWICAHIPAFSHTLQKSSKASLTTIQMTAVCAIDKINILM